MSDLGNKDVFAYNLRRYMEKKGIDRNQLCRALGLKYSTVSEWISAKKYPRIDRIELLAKYFGVQKSNLIERENISVSPSPARVGLELTQHEESVIIAYRNKPAIQPAVDKLLDVSPSEEPQILAAARGGGYVSPETVKELIDKIDTLPDFVD